MPPKGNRRGEEPTAEKVQEGQQTQNYQNLFVAKLPELIRQDDVMVIFREGIRKANDRRAVATASPASGANNASALSTAVASPVAAVQVSPLNTPQSTMVSLDPSTGTSKGFGFALFASNADGAATHKVLNNSTVLYNHVTKKVLNFTLSGDTAEEGSLVVPKHNKKGRGKGQGGVLDGDVTLYPFRLVLTGSRFDGVTAAAASPCLYVRNIPLDLSQRDVSELLGEFGQVVFCAVRHDHLQRPIWVVFVEYDTVESAQRALTALHGNKTLFPRSPPILAKFADTQEQREQRKVMRHNTAPGPHAQSPQHQHTDPTKAAAAPASTGPFGLPQHSQPPPLVNTQQQPSQGHSGRPYTIGGGNTPSFAPAAIPVPGRGKAPLVSLLVPAAELGEDGEPVVAGVDGVQLAVINDSMSSIPEVITDKRMPSMTNPPHKLANSASGHMPPAPPEAAISPSARKNHQKPVTASAQSDPRSSQFNPSQPFNAGSPSNSHSATTPSGGGNTHFRFNPYAVDLPYVALEVVNTMGEPAGTGSRGGSLAATPTAYRRSQQLLTPTAGGRPAIAFPPPTSGAPHASAIALNPNFNNSLSASRGNQTTSSASASLLPSGPQQQGKRASHSASSDLATGSPMAKDSNHHINIVIPQNWKGAVTPMAASSNGNSNHNPKSTTNSSPQNSGHSNNQSLAAAKARPTPDSADTSTASTSGNLRTYSQPPTTGGGQLAPAGGPSIGSSVGGVLGSAALYSPMAAAGPQVVERVFPPQMSDHQPHQQQQVNHQQALPHAMSFATNDQARALMMGQPIDCMEGPSSVGDEAAPPTGHNYQSRPGTVSNNARSSVNASAEAYYPQQNQHQQQQQWFPNYGQSRYVPYHPQQFPQQQQQRLQQQQYNNQQSGNHYQQHHHQGGVPNPIPASQGGVLRPMWSRGIEWETVGKGNQ